VPGEQQGYEVMRVEGSDKFVVYSHDEAGWASPSQQFDSPEAAQAWIDGWTFRNREDGGDAEEERTKAAVLARPRTSEERVAWMEQSSMFSIEPTVAIQRAMETWRDSFPHLDYGALIAVLHADAAAAWMRQFAGHLRDPDAPEKYAALGMPMHDDPEVRKIQANAYEHAAYVVTGFAK
jgi:hypothetical protein